MRRASAYRARMERVWVGPTIAMIWGEEVVKIEQREENELESETSEETQVGAGIVSAGGMVW